MDSSISISKTFVRALLKLRNEKEVENFLSDLLSVSEIKTLELRWKIIEMLNESLPYVEISKRTGASSATIAKLNQKYKFGTGNFHTVLERLKKKV